MSKPFTKSSLLKSFASVYGSSRGARVFFAPGRVNLIGEHTDYNGGHVFPCAITLGTALAIRPRKDRFIHLCSRNIPRAGIITVSLDELDYAPIHGWANYPKGIFVTLAELGYTCPCGADLYFSGNLPNSSGLSSSACIEVLTAYALSELFGWKLDPVEIAKLSQRSENRYNGVNCGIMDQFAIAMGRPSQAIFLDTGTLKYEYVPLELGDYRLLIMNTNKRRGLADSKYNERRAECEDALRSLQTRLNAASLGALTDAEFEKNAGLIADPVKRKRAKHAVSENQRTIKAVSALRAGDLAEFARLIDASGDSLREDYEVTGPELDTLVAAARKQPGVLCARMTGAGFGGCAIALVEASRLKKVIRAVGARYRRVIGYDASFYEACPGGGPCELK